MTVYGSFLCFELTMARLNQFSVIKENNLLKVSLYFMKMYISIGYILGIYKRFSISYTIVLSYF